MKHLFTYPVRMNKLSYLIKQLLIKRNKVEKFIRSTIFFLQIVLLAYNLLAVKTVICKIFRNTLNNIFSKILKSKVLNLCRIQDTLASILAVSSVSAKIELENSSFISLTNSSNSCTLTTLKLEIIRTFCSIIQMRKEKLLEVPIVLILTLRKSQEYSSTLSLCHPLVRTSF